MNDLYYICPKGRKEERNMKNYVKFEIEKAEKEIEYLSSDEAKKEMKEELRQNLINYYYGIIKAYKDWLSTLE